MADDPTQPRDPSDAPSEGTLAGTGEPPPFEPDPELIGYLEREQKGDTERR
jgi:hypothetical protein